MLGKILSGDGRSKSRLERGKRQLEKLGDKVARIQDADARSKAAYLRRKIVRLKSDLDSRIDQLAIAKGKSFGWLREDVAALLERFEDSLRALRRLVGEQELADKPVQELEEAPGKMEVKASAEPDKQPEEKPQPVSSKPMTETARVVFTEPAWAERANLDARGDLAVVHPAGPPKDVDAAFRQLPCLKTELATWQGELNQTLARLEHLQSDVPPGYTSIRWRYILREAAFLHRTAKEQVGQCRRWVMGEPMLLAARAKDWRHDFNEAQASLSELARRMEKIQSLAQEARERPPKETQDSEVDRIKTTRIRPGMMAKELEEMGISLSADEEETVNPPQKEKARQQHELFGAQKSALPQKQRS